MSAWAPDEPDYDKYTLSMGLLDRNRIDRDQFFSVFDPGKTCSLGGLSSEMYEKPRFFLCIRAFSGS